MLVSSLNVADILPRSAQQVTERLDRLIAKIRDTQKQYMNGDKPADVVVVRLEFLFLKELVLIQHCRAKKPRLILCVQAPISGQVRGYKNPLTGGLNARQSLLDLFLFGPC